MLDIVGGKRGEHLYSRGRGESRVMMMAMMSRSGSSEYHGARRDDNEISIYPVCIGSAGALKEISQFGEPMRCLLGPSYRSQR